MKQLVALVALLIAYAIVTVAAGRFTQTDEIAFKAAGREWAQSGRFAAPELSGFGPFTPPVEEIWLAHLPVYTFAFGVFVRVLGFGAWQSVAFDALIHAALAALTFALCLRASPPSRWRAVLAAALVLPLGTAGRADELAVCFAMAGIVVVSKALATPRLIATGVLFGVAAATSAPAAALLGLHLLLLVRRPRALAIIVATAAVAAAMCITPIAIAHPDALQQFRSHASGQFRQSFGWALAHSWEYGKPYMLSFAAAAIPAAGSLAAWPSIVAGLLVLALVPAKSYYLWFVTPLLIALACARGRRALLFIAAILWLFAIVRPVQQLVIAATLPPDQRLAPNGEIIRRIVPRGSVVVSSEYWSSIANDVEYRSLVHAEPDWNEIDFVILTGNGSGVPGRRQGVSRKHYAIIESQFELVHDNLRRDAPSLFGVRLGDSGWGFGMQIYARRTNASTAARSSGSSIPLQ